MSEALQLEDLLRGLQSEGKVDSSGSFTMDFEKAAPKLRKFLLQNPFHYALKLIQAAVAAGADRIQLDIGDVQARYKLVGASLASAEVRKLFYYLLEAKHSRENRALRHLAIGLNGLVSLGCSLIRLYNWDGAESYATEWTSGGQQEIEFREKRGEAPYLRIEVIRSLDDQAAGLWARLNRDFGAMLNSSRKTLDREQACIVDRCFCCPVPLYLNRRRIDRPYTGWEFISEGKRSSENTANLSYRTIETSDPSHSGLRLPKITAALEFPSASKQLQALLLLGCDWAPRSHLLMVEDGVLLAQQMSYLGRVGLSVMLCGSLFTLDLTGLTVAMDTRYSAALLPLSGWAEELRQATFRAWPSIDRKLTHSMEAMGLAPGLLQPPQVRRLLG